jgi:hypothetical protein
MRARGRNRGDRVQTGSTTGTSATSNLSCSERLDRVRAYVLRMRDLREATWRPSDDRSIEAR